MSIVQHVCKSTVARAVEGEIPIQSRYTYGLAGERFFREIMENARLLGTRCNKCDYTYVPPVIYCERCFSSLDHWVEVSARGSVLSFTVVMVALDGSPLDEPEIMALVQLDGADGVLVHRLGGVNVEDLAIGMRVQATFKPRKERKGSILDISHFAPAET